VSGGGVVTGFVLGWLAFLAIGLWWSLTPESANRFYGFFGQRWVPSGVLRALGVVMLVVFVLGGVMLAISQPSWHR
jgi:hypothetical protein